MMYTSEFRFRSSNIVNLYASKVKISIKLVEIEIDMDNRRDCHGKTKKMTLITIDPVAFSAAHTSFCTRLGSGYFFFREL
jgi:hypothetical protein